MSDACLPSRRLPTWRTAVLLTFAAAACCAQDRIVSYKHCDEGDSGIRVLNSGGRELLRLCQVGWPDQARFVQLTGSKATDLFYATRAGAKLGVATVYRKQGNRYTRVGEFEGFFISVIHLHNKPVVAMKPLQYGSGSLTQLYVWDRNTFRRCDESFPKFFEPEIQEQWQVLDDSGLPAYVFAEACQLGATALLYSKKYIEAEELCKKALQVVNTRSRLSPSVIGGSAEVVHQDQSAAEQQINDSLSAIHNAKQRDATTDSGLNPCNGQPRSGHLAIVPNMDASTGLVTVNGHDDRRPTRTPLSWTWGDDSTKQGWFPQSHVYANTKQNYVIQVIAHEDDGSTDCEWFETAFSQ